MRYCQYNKFNLPDYECVHIGNKFETTVYINNVEYGCGEGHNKKSSEQQAAYATLVQFREITP